MAALKSSFYSALSIFKHRYWGVLQYSVRSRFPFHTLMSSSPPLLLFLHHVNCLLLMLNMELFAFCKQLE